MRMRPDTGEMHGERGSGRAPDFVESIAACDLPVAPGESLDDRLVVETLPGQRDDLCLHDDPETDRQRGILDMPGVERGLFVRRDHVPAIDLGPAGDARPDVEMQRRVGQLVHRSSGRVPISDMSPTRMFGSFGFRRAGCGG